MLDLLIKKDIYSKTYCQFFAGGTAFEAVDGSYDAVVVNGAFVKGHLPVDAPREIARILKRGLWKFKDCINK